MYLFKKHHLKTRIYLLLIPLFYTYNTVNAQVNPTPLNQIWEKALAFNKTIQMRNLQVAATDEAIKDARAERLPEIEVEAEYAKVSNMPIYENGLFHTHSQFEVLHTAYDFGGNTYLNLYNGNKTNLKIKEEKDKKELAIAQRNLSTSEIKLSATAYYLDLQRSKIFKNLVLKDISDQEKQLEEIKQLLKNGVVLKSDVLRAELKLSRQKMSLVQLDNDIAIANQKLNILIGNPDEEKINPDTVIHFNYPLKTYQEYLTEASEHAWEAQISEQETKLSKLELQNTRSPALKLGLFANYAYSYPQIRFYPYAISLYGLGLGGIKASYSISSLYHNKHKVQEAEINYKRQEIEHLATADGVRQKVNEAFLRYQEALTRINVAQQNIHQAAENFRIVNNTYFNQLSLLTDLLDADTQLLQTKFDLAAAQIAAQLQYYQLQKAIGNL